MPHSGPVVVRAGLLRNVVRFSGKAEIPTKSFLEFYSLASDKADRHMEPFIIDIHPSPKESHKLSSHEERNSSMSFQEKSRSSTGKMFKG
jgi:hypothetical protein